MSALPGLAESTWVSAIVGDGLLVPVRASSELKGGDEVLRLIDRKQHVADVLRLFAAINAGR